MAVMNNKYQLLDVAPDNLFGVRREGQDLYIGNTPIELRGKILLVGNDDEFLMTDGLMQLLTKKDPIKYTNEDLKEYKNILLLTNAHRRCYKAHCQINANNSLKYKNVVSILFPPKRPAKSRIRSDKKLILKTNEHQSKLEEVNKSSVSGSEIKIQEDIPNARKYMYYEDPNVLVDRFRELDTEQEQGVDNREEILCILRELEKLGYIKFYK